MRHWSAEDSNVPLNWEELQEELADEIGTAGDGIPSFRSGIGYY